MILSQVFSCFLSEPLDFFLNSFYSVLPHFFSFSAWLPPFDFSLCQVTPKLSLFVLTSCEESPPLSSFLPGYLPPPKMLRSIFSEAELLHDLYQSPSGLLLKSYFPDAPHTPPRTLFSHWARSNRVVLDGWQRRGGGWEQPRSGSPRPTRRGGLVFAQYIE